MCVIKRDGRGPWWLALFVAVVLSSFILPQPVAAEGNEGAKTGWYYNPPERRQLDDGSWLIHAVRYDNDVIRQVGSFVVTNDEYQALLSWIVGEHAIDVRIAPIDLGDGAAIEWQHWWLNGRQVRQLGWMPKIEGCNPRSAWLGTESWYISPDGKTVVLESETEVYRFRLDLPRLREELGAPALDFWRPGDGIVRLDLCGTGERAQLLIPLDGAFINRGVHRIPVTEYVVVP